jgi:formiminoglutamate deiminase
MADLTGARRIWCRHASLPAGVAASVLIEIEGGTITSVATGADPPDDAERLGGLTLPGFANAHSHAFHRALRSRTHRGSSDFWSWRQQMYSVAARLTPASYRALARATFAEMVQAGYTVVGEFHYVHHQGDGAPYDDPNAMGAAIVEAATQAGIRLTLLDACYLRGGAGQPLADEQRRFSDGSPEAWVARVGALADQEGVRIGAAVHSVRAVDAASISVAAAFAEASGLPLHAHVSEQVAENDATLQERGCTPMELLANQGALSSRFTAVHATHLQPVDLDLLASAGGTTCFCPTTERDLADGIGPSAELRAQGVPLAIGSDQQAVIDPFEEMRAIELHERLRSGRRGTHPAAELLAAGSANGYACLGWPTGGAIEVGALADLTTLSFESARLAGVPDHARLEAAVFAATSADVDTVVVGGRTVVRGGRHLTIDVAGELREAILAVAG